MSEFISDKNQRLDIFLASKLNSSRNQISKLIKSGAIKINDRLITKNSTKLEIGDKIILCIKKDIKTSSFLEPKFDVEILFEDDDILVINKPSGVVVHSAPSVKEPTLVDWLIKNNFMLSNLNGDIRPGVVHRLDKGTSGVMIVAKNNASHRFLASQLQDKSMGRIYLLLTNLGLKEDLIIDKPIGRNPKNRLKMDVIPNAREAKTAFKILDEESNFLAAKLFSGRTHQIRVHLKFINRFILGDELYGFKSDLQKINRIMLHSYLLYFIHPKTKKMMMIKAKLPDEFYKFIKKDLVDEKTNNLFSSFNDCAKWMCK